MKTDAQLCLEVVDALRRDAQIQSIEIGIWVKDGVVILTGYADSYSKKSAAEQIAKRIAGVKGVVNDIQLRLPRAGERTDAEIAVETRDRKVVLRGRVRSWAERAEAWRVAWQISGVTSVENLIEVAVR